MKNKYAKYDAFEIHPCLLLDANNNPVKNDDPMGISYDQCDEDDPNLAVWSVYGHIPGQGIESISDHPTKEAAQIAIISLVKACLLYTSPSPRDGLLSRMPSSA